MTRTKSDSGNDEFPQDINDTDEIEILEVVGLEEVDRTESYPSVDRKPAHGARRSEERETAVEQRESAEEQRLSEQLLRLQADYDNYRKRVEREREHHRRMAGENLVRELLPVLDNFERALSAAGESSHGGNFRDGVVLMFRQLLETLRQEGLSAIDSIGEPFDPTLHEAVATTAYTGLPTNTVVEELQRGYLLHDRLLRPSLVRVSIDDAPDGQRDVQGEG